MNKMFGLLVGTALLLGGCHSPEVTTSVDVHPDDDPLGGAISSGDIRTVATRMTPAILALPEIADRDQVVRIAVADFSNNSRFIIDRNLFMRRLRLELNRTSGGKVRFFAQSSKVQQTRNIVLNEQQEELVRERLRELGKELAALPMLNRTDGKPVKVAVLPVINTNLVNMNGDSFAAMLRAEVARAGKGKVQFLLPGVTQGADFYLTGQFIPEGIRREAIIDMGTYIQVIEARIKRGESLDLTDGRVPATSNRRDTPLIGNQIEIQQESVLVKMMTDPALRANPNVNKRLNVMLVQPAGQAAVYEQMFLLERKQDSGIARADYILSGEIGAQSLRSQGKASDYLLISVQLTDPRSNEIVWEDGYETKRITKSGIVYQ